MRDNILPWSEMFERIIKNVQGGYTSLQANKILSSELSQFPVPFTS